MKKSIALISLASAVCLLASCGAVPKTADILITGGTVYDGSENAPQVADVAIKGDKVVYVGKAKENIADKCKAAKVIDAAGYVVCPGFIDPHDHMESTLLKDKAAESYLRMGVTTVITGMCGGSQYPVKNFFDKLEKQGMGPNVASFTGHNTIRSKVMGSENRFATDDEIAKMEKMIQEDMDNGSLGLSTGLYYVPGCFSENREVVSIAKAMASRGGIYTTHVRNENKEGIGLYNSIVEALEIGKQAGVQVNISHIKCLGKSVWHRSDSVINVIEQYQKDGVKVTADQYPYLASGLAMTSALTPAWARDGGVKALRERYKDPETLAKIKSEIPDMIYERGGAETIFISKRAGEFNGMTLEQATKKLGLTDPADAVIELTKKMSPYLNTFVANEDDLANYMKKPWVMTCTDGSYGTHPRAAGSYAELLQTYVLDKKFISFDRFVRRSTGQVADTYRLQGRGYIKVGGYADINIFKPEEVRANATYSDPALLSTGFRNVIVNGQIAVDNDQYTGALSGKVIRRETNKK